MNDVTTFGDYDFGSALEWNHGWPVGWNEHEFHDADSVQLGELVEVGWFDMSDKVTWHWPQFSDEQDARLRDKIVNRFWNRGIGVLPPGLWKRQFLEKMAEIMPKYILMYQAQADATLPYGSDSEYYKSRNIFSDFPQTQLSGNSDYASTGNDTEYERIRQKDVLDTLDGLDNYKDIDLIILKELEEMFSCLVSVSLNTR